MQCCQLLLLFFLVNKIVSRKFIWKCCQQKRDIFSPRCANRCSCILIFAEYILLTEWRPHTLVAILKNNPTSYIPSQVQTYSLFGIKVYDPELQINNSEYHSSLCSVHSLGPGDAIWRHGTRSTLAQVMACCLLAPSHYLKQCWLIIGEVLWHSSQGIILTWCEDTNQWNEIENCSFKMARFNIKMISYQHRKSHCRDETILRPSYLHNGISYTGKMTSLYWIRAQVSQGPMS